MSEGTGQIRSQLQDLTKAIGAAQPAFRQLDGSLNAALTRLATTEERAIESWRSAGHQVSAALEKAVSHIAERNGVQGPTSTSPEVASLLPRIAESVHAKPQSILPLLAIGLLALNVIAVGLLLWAFVRLR